MYWPALLLAAGYDVPRQLFVHGYLLLNDRKISKSLGNVVDPLDLIDVYGADAVRFWCARSVSFGQDGVASIDGLRERYERELGNDLGNLLSRVTAMVARYRQGTLAAVPSDDSEVAAILAPLRDDVAARLDAFDLTGALERIWEVVRGLNRHVEVTAPWRLAKEEANAEALDRVLYDLVDGLRAVAVALAAYLPDTSARILAAVGQAQALDWAVAPAARARPRTWSPAAPLFPRVDEPAGRVSGRGRRRGGPEPRRSTAPVRRVTRCEAPSRPARSGSLGRVRAQDRRVGRGVIDTHAHLDICEAGPGEVLARARAAGVDRVVTIGTGIDSCRRALEIADSQSGVFAALGIDPHQAATPEADRLDELREFLVTRESSRSARWGSTATTAPAPCGSSALFDAQLALAEEVGLPVVIHSRRRARRRPLRWRRSVEGSSCTASPSPTCSHRRSSAATTSPLPGTSPIRTRKRSATQLCAARGRILAETDSPYLAPQPVRGRRNEPMHIVHTLAVLASTRNETEDELERRIEENAATAFELPPT